VKCHSLEEREALVHVQLTDKLRRNINPNAEEESKTPIVFFLVFRAKISVRRGVWKRLWKRWRQDVAKYIFIEPRIRENNFAGRIYQNEIGDSVRWEFLANFLMSVEIWPRLFRCGPKFSGSLVSTMGFANYPTAILVGLWRYSSLQQVNRRYLAGERDSKQWELKMSVSFCSLLLTMVVTALFLGVNGLYLK
jgi:hypothetical protein